MFKFLKRLFSSSPERLALKVIENNRKVITEAGGSYELLSSYWKTHYENNAVNISMNCLGLDFEHEPGKQVLQLAVLDLLYESQKKFMLRATFDSMAENGKEFDTEGSSQLLERLKSDEYKESSEYRMAKTMNGVVARMVSYDEAMAGQTNSGLELAETSEDLLFDQAKRLAVAELVSEIINISGMDCGDQVALYTRKIRSFESPNLTYWQRVATQRDNQAEESFTKWDGRDNFTVLGQLVKGES